MVRLVSRIQMRSSKCRRMCLRLSIYTKKEAIKQLYCRVETPIRYRMFGGLIMAFSGRLIKPKLLKVAPKSYLKPQLCLVLIALKTNSKTSPTLQSYSGIYLAQYLSIKVWQMITSSRMKQDKLTVFVNRPLRENFWKCDWEPSAICSISSSVDSTYCKYWLQNNP